jgi:CubicO group peptidase (beta-lactamase class C family)
VTDAFTAAGLARVDEIVSAAVAQGQVPGVVAAVASGNGVHMFVAGEATVGGEPMRPDTLFRIASLTKPMAAAAVLSLAEDGALTLDEPIERLLPELAGRRVLRRPDAPLDDTEPVDPQPTVRQLLTFTWGIGMQGAMFVAPQPWPIVTAAAERSLQTFGPPAPGSTPDPDTWLARLAELPLIAAPGERWLYSTGAQVLSVLAARAAGTPFDEVLRQRLFGPLEMSDTAFWTSDTARVATAYARPGGELTVIDPPDGQWSRPPAFPDGAGGLLSTAADVVAFGRMLLRGGAGLLRAETVAAMTTDQLTEAQRTYPWGGFDMLDGQGWGFGLSAYDDGSYGWDGGSGTRWRNVPELDLTVVVLTQRQFDENGPPAVCADVVNAAKSALA